MATGNATLLKNEYGFDVAAAREELLKRAGRVWGPRVLDIGTGYGSMAVVLAQHGFAVTAVDIDEKSLHCARDRVGRNDRELLDHIRFVRADATQLPFRSRTFDGVFSFDSLHHMSNCSATMGEMLRVCKPGGVLAVADLNVKGAQVVADVIARGGKPHFHNGCGVEVVGEVLRRRWLVFHRYTLEFVTVFVARSPVKRSRGHS